MAKEGFSSLLLRLLLVLFLCRALSAEVAELPLDFIYQITLGLFIPYLSISLFTDVHPQPS